MTLDSLGLEQIRGFSVSLQGQLKVGDQDHGQHWVWNTLATHFQGRWEYLLSYIAHLLRNLVKNFINRFIFASVLFLWLTMQRRLQLVLVTAVVASELMWPSGIFCTQ